MATAPDGGEGDYYPSSSAPESQRSVSEPQAISSKSAASLTPRGRVFPSFGEAHLNITQLRSNNPFLKTSDNTPNASNGDLPSSSSGKPVTDLDADVSQDAVPTRSATQATGSPQSKRRRHSITSIVPLTDLPSSADKPEMGGTGPGKAPEPKVASDNRQPLDTSANTVERIYDEYVASGPDRLSSSIDSSSHGYTFAAVSRPLDTDPPCREGAATRCGFRGEESRGLQRKPRENAIQEHQHQIDFPPLQPPHTSLPKSPPVHTKSISTLTRDEDISPPPNSSISDSQHLLDAEAQVDKLRKVRRELMPEPLRIPSNRGFKGSEQRKYGGILSGAISTIANNTSESNEDPFKYDGNGYHTFLHPSAERDVSQALKRISKGAGTSSGGFLSSSETSPPKRTRAKPPISALNLSPVGQERLGEDFFDPDALRATVPGDRRVRDIKIVIDRKPQIEHGKDSPYDGANDPKLGGAVSSDVRGKLPKDAASEADWVTETTSEFAFGSDSAPSTKFRGGIKATGSSIADYSDDDNDPVQGPFGPQGRVLRHPTGGSRPNRYGIRKLKDTEQPVIFPRRTNGFPENSIRLYSSKNKDESSLSRPSFSRKPSNPFLQGGYRRGSSTNRLSFGFPRKASSKYDFRDSTSEYGPAGASNQATCGTYESLNSVPSPEAGEDNYQSTTDARFDRSADYEAERNPSARTSTFQDTHTTSQRVGDSRRPGDTFEGSYRKRMPKDLGQRQFATASAGKWENEPSSINSKFNFELLPIDIAQKKYKKERDSGETDDTESFKLRIHRKKSAQSGDDTLDSSGVQLPLPAHVRQACLARNLSSDFTPPSIHSFQDDLLDTPTPLGATMKDQFSPASGSGRYFPKNRALGSPATPSTYYGGTPTMKKTRWLRKEKSRPLLPTARNRRRNNNTSRTRRSTRDQNPFLSSEDMFDPATARSRQKFWFYTMVMLSILPFFAVLVLTGVFDDSLSWFTRGAHSRLSLQQRKVIKWMFIIECVVYTACLAAIVVYYVMKSKTSS